MSEYNTQSTTYTAGYVTAYGAAKRGGYTGTYEEFCAAIAGMAVTVEDLENFSVVINTLSPGSSATASYANGVLTLGVPQGAKGDKGDKGDTGEVSQAELDEAIGAIKNDLSGTVKTVNGSLPDANGNVEVNSAMSDTTTALLMEVLSEAFYASDQTDNLLALDAALKGHRLVSITASVVGTPLIGMAYSDLTYDVTAVYSDGTETSVSNYQVSSGTVVSGSNTVTITYRTASATITFEASPVVTYTVTYALSGITSSNTSAVAVKDDPYITELTVEPNYEFSSCVVTMGGVDITSTVFSNMEITIPEVTGNIVITAVAIENQPLDILVPIAANARPVVFVYSDDFQTQLTRYNNTAYVYVSEYPALNACRIKWKITNTSEASVNINAFGIGCIPAFDQSWKIDAYFRVAYFNEITISGNTLDAGNSLEGVYDLRAGYQLVFIISNNAKNAVSIELIGSFEPDTFDGYTKLTSDGTTAFGSYRTVTWYKDAGTTALTTGKSSMFNLYDKNLSAGQYDVIGRLKPKAEAFDYDRLVAGAVTDSSSTDVYNSFGLSVDSTTVPMHMWVYGQMTIASDGMTLISTLSNPSNRVIELYVKERE